MASNKRHEKGKVGKEIKALRPHFLASVIGRSEHADEDAPLRGAAFRPSSGPRTLPHIGYRQERARR